MAQARVNDFSGGETDRFRDGQPNFAQLMKNLYVSENRRLFSRPGFGGLLADARPLGNTDIAAIWNHSVEGVEQTFFIANSTGTPAVRYNNNGIWTVATAADGTTNQIPNWTPASRVPSIKYIRLNDSEFVIVFGDIGLSGYPVKFIRSTIGVWKYVSLGLPTNVDLMSTSPQAIGGNNWLYAAVLKHTYQIFESGSGFITKEVRSAPQFSGTNNGVSEVNVNTDSFTAVLNSDWRDNLDGVLLTSGTFAYADCTWEIYRTVSDGSVFYKIAEVATGSTYSDTDILNPDADITSGAQLYTTGGAVANEMSNARVFDGTFANDALWLASAQRVWQSKVGIYDAVNGSFNFSAREGQFIKAVESIDVYPIILTNQGVYRIEGIVDDLGNGTHRVRTISETDGALSSRTTVKAGDRLYYLTVDGIYVTNGYTTSKVSNHYNEKYRSFIDRVGVWDGDDTSVADLMFGVWDKKHRRIHWFIPKAGESYASDVMTLDLKYPHEEGLCITTGEVPYTVRDADLVDGNIQLVTNLGYVLAQNDDNTYDVDENNGLDPLGIEWDYVSCSMAFGSSIIRKFFTRLLLHFTNRSDLTVKVQSDTDESNDYRDHNFIRERGFTRGLYFLKRWFPKGKLRGTYKTIRITNEAQVLFRSDDYALANTSGTSGVTSDASNWPAAIEVDYEISFAPYTTKHRIATASGGDTLTFNTSVGTANGRPWQITGIPTTEKIEMNGYTVDYYAPQEGHTQSATVVQGND